MGNPELLRANLRELADLIQRPILHEVTHVTDRSVAQDAFDPDLLRSETLENLSRQLGAAVAGLAEGSTTQRHDDGTIKTTMRVVAMTPANWKHLCYLVENTIRQLEDA